MEWMQLLWRLVCYRPVGFIDVRASEVMVIFVISIPCVCLLPILLTEMFTCVSTYFRKVQQHDMLSSQ